MDLVIHEFDVHKTVGMYSLNKIFWVRIEQVSPTRVTNLKIKELENTVPINSIKNVTSGDCNEVIDLKLQNKPLENNQHNMPKKNYSNSLIIFQVIFVKKSKFGVILVYVLTKLNDLICHIR